MKGYHMYSKIQQLRSAGFSQRQVTRFLDCLYTGTRLGPKFFLIFAGKSPHGIIPCGPFIRLYASCSSRIS